MPVGPPEVLKDVLMTDHIGIEREVMGFSRRTSGGTRAENRRTCPAEKAEPRAGFRYPGNADDRV